jgi:hypothetical protein
MLLAGSSGMTRCDASPLSGWRHSLWRYMEAYVNDGSPSGYHAKPPYPYSPSICRTFRLLQVSPPQHEVSTIGAFPNLLDQPMASDSVPIFLHPLANPPQERMEELGWIHSSFHCVASASGRTVWLYLPQYGYWSRWQLKLHYPNILGRLTRPLPFYRAVSGVEVSNALKSLPRDDSIFEDASFMLESAARVWQSQIGVENAIGLVVRDTIPYPRISGNSIFIPLFSLWSSDINKRMHRTALEWLQLYSGLTASDLQERLVVLLVRSYCRLAAKGLHPEMNAQNCLIEASPARIRIVFRDLTDAEKNRQAIEIAGLQSSFGLTSKRFVDARIDRAHAEKRLSLSYDFRLGDYVLDPLISTLARHTGTSTRFLESLAKRTFHDSTSDAQWALLLPSEGRWAYKPVIYDRSAKPYTYQSAVPKYR